jgi:uncharacterized membrane protein (UPF0182 family)
MKIKDIFPTDISKHQAKDTGMAVVLILLLIGVIRQEFTIIKIAIFTLLLTMAFPLIYKYVAVLWLGTANFLGTIVSKIILSLIFFIVVLPVGFIRRLFGYDTLKLKEFKNGTDSVMQIRKITFTTDDINKPF